MLVEALLPAAKALAIEYITPLNIFLLIAICVLFDFMRSVVRYRFFHPLKDFPGPFWWAVSRLPLAWNNVMDTEIEKTRAMIGKYGPIVRISPTLLLVSTARALPLIYHRTAKKTPHYTVFSFGSEPTVFHMLEHPDYTERAKMVAGIYSSRAHMPSTEATLDFHLTKWVSKLRFIYIPSSYISPRARSNYTPPDALDVARWIQFLTMDVIIELALGSSNALNFVDNGRDMLGLCAGFKSSLPFYGWVCRTYPFWNWLDRTIFGRYFDWHMLRLDNLIGLTTRFVERCLLKRLKELENRETDLKESRSDMMQAFINARSPSTGLQLSTPQLRSEILIVLMAGADNTTSAICTTLFHLISSPSALSRVLEEVETATSAGKISSVPQHSEILQWCPFYIACVKESLRLNPSLPSFLPRYSEEGLVINNIPIPAGTEIASNPWITGRDPEIYGDDVEEWKPERWLDVERARVMEKYSFVFGYGSRPCLGAKMGWLSACKVPLMFLKSFKSELATENGKQPRLTVRADFSYWEDFMVRIRKREVEVRDGKVCE